MPPKQKRPVYLVVKRLGVPVLIDGKEEEAVAIVDLKLSRGAADAVAARQKGLEVVKKYMVG